MASQASVRLLLVVVCIGFVSAEIPVDCCLSTTDKSLPRYRVASYIIQHAGRGCGVSATVFITKIGKRLCVPHPSQSRWVQNIIDHLLRGKGAHP